ncbi:MAG: hypothetical protein ABI548_01000 [Polyangiaceae bacterium]
MFFDPSVIPRPKSKRGLALWEAYRRAWSAKMRFERRTQKKKAKLRGQGAPLFDDKLVDRAIENLQRAHAATRNAIEFLSAHSAKQTEAAVGIGWNKDYLSKEPPPSVGAAVRIKSAVEDLIGDLTTFAGVPQPRTRGDWDRFVSTSAAELLDAGFSSREVAGLLTGQRPERVDRATLERFRQRVRRREISAG